MRASGLTFLAFVCAIALEQQLELFAGPQETGFTSSPRSSQAPLDDSGMPVPVEDEVESETPESGEGNSGELTLLPKCTTASRLMPWHRLDSSFAPTLLDTLKRLLI